MNRVLVAIGLSVFAGVVIADLNEKVTVGWGYFLVVAALLLSAALWRDSLLEGSGNRRMYDVYAALQEGPLPIEELLRTVTGGHVEYEMANSYRATIARMIMDGNLVIVDGKVAIA